MNLFGAAVAARNALYDRGVLRQSRLRRPVVSVGSIAVGGAGKTPFVIYLARLLRERGVRVDVLSRGYGRRSSGVLVVEGRPADGIISQEEALTGSRELPTLAPLRSAKVGHLLAADPGEAARFGDEPVLIRRLAEVPVIVGESRYQAGVEAERRFDSDLHLLDDGFQHRELARDFDIVLLSPHDLQDRLLPLGRLREPLSSLGRAHAIVWSADPAGPALPPALSMGKPVWRLRRRIELPPGSPSRPFAFCAIAEPERFRCDLENAGTRPAGFRCFRDHHAYRASDIAALLHEAKRAGANGFVTTEKDAVKLGPFRRQLGETALARLVVELEEPQAAVSMLLAKIDASKIIRKEQS
jgi:tetraacyldisaccharide 4'-kinase